MSSTTPPPPKHGGSGPFIAAAVVMLLLMGTLIVWKLSGDDDKPTPATPPVATVAPPVLEEPPPPPPPIEPPKEAVAEPKQPIKRVASGGPGGCSSECKGTDPGGIRGQLSGKAAAARGCYERALRQNAMLQGRMKVAVKVGPSGSVCNASVTQNDVGDPGIATCVLQIFRTATFAAPQGGCIDFEVPLRFEPKT